MQFKFACGQVCDGFVHKLLKRTRRETSGSSKQGLALNSCNYIRKEPALGLGSIKMTS